MAKTPDFVTTEDCTLLKDDQWNKLVIPAGTFVRPIELKYLPQHVKDSILYRFYLPTLEVFVYCRYGIVPVPKNIIRRV